MSGFLALLIEEGEDDAAARGHAGGDDDGGPSASSGTGIRFRIGHAKGRHLHRKRILSRLLQRISRNLQGRGRECTEEET